MNQVTFPCQTEKKPSGFNLLLNLVDHDMAEVNSLIVQKTISHVQTIPDLAQYLINSGGKRLRPMLTIASAQMCGHREKKHILLAAAIEFLHTATLLHDDVVDESSMRRGKVTSHLLWGNQTSVLVGDYLLGQAFKMMVEAGSIEALSILSDAAVTIAEGEVWQSSVAHRLATTKKEYLGIIYSKTAVLFAAALEIGGVISSSNVEKKASLRSFGVNFGTAFQLIDDALDYAGNSHDLGKSTGDDFREGKVTLPVIISYQKGNAQERDFWIRTFQDKDIREGDLEHGIALMHQHAAIEATFELARHYGEIARSNVEKFPDCFQKDAFLEIIDFCLKRSY